MTLFKGNVKRINRPSLPSSALKPHYRLELKARSACMLHFKSSPLSAGHHRRSTGRAFGAPLHVSTIVLLGLLNGGPRSGPGWQAHLDTLNLEINIWSLS